MSSQSRVEALQAKNRIVNTNLQPALELLELAADRILHFTPSDHISKIAALKLYADVGYDQKINLACNVMERSPWSDRCIQTLMSEDHAGKHLKEYLEEIPLDLQVRSLRRECKKKNLFPPDAPKKVVSNFLRAAAPLIYSSSYEPAVMEENEFFDFLSDVKELGEDKCMSFMTKYSETPSLHRLFSLPKSVQGKRVQALEEIKTIHALSQMNLQNSSASKRDEAAGSMESSHSKKKNEEKPTLKEEATVSRDPTWIADNLKTPGDLWKLGNMKYIDTQDGCIRLRCKESAYEDIEIKIPQKQMEAFGGTSFINDLGNVKSQKIPFHLSPQEPSDEKDLIPRFTVKQGEWVLPTLSPSMQAVHDRFQGFANGTYDLYIANSGKNTQAKYIPADENFNKNNKQYPVYAFDAAKMSDLGLKALEVQKRQGGGFLYPSAATRAHCEVKLVTSQENNAVRLGFSVNGERRPLQTSINLEPQQDRPLYNALKTLSPINGNPFNPQAGAELSWAKGAYVLTQGTEKWSIDTKHKAYKACDDRAHGRQPNRNR